MKPINFQILLSFTFLMCISLFSFGQKGKSITATPVLNNNAAYETESRVFHMSLKYSDLPTATKALFNMIALNPENKSLKDTLCFLYFQRKAWEQCILVGTEILQYKSDDIAITEAVAFSQKSLNLTRESLSKYEKLYQMNGNVLYLYEVAKLQYALKRNGEFDVSVNNLMNHPEAASKKVTVQLPENRQQNVLLKSACLNLKGVLLLESKDYVNAKKHFEAANQIDPQFVLPVNNLKVLAQIGKGK